MGEEERERERETETERESAVQQQRLYGKDRHGRRHTS